MLKIESGSLIVAVVAGVLYLQSDLSAQALSQC